MEKNYLPGEGTPQPADLILVVTDSGVVIPEGGVFWAYHGLTIPRSELVPVGSLGSAAVFVCHHSVAQFYGRLPGGQAIPLRELYGLIEEPVFWFAGRAAHVYHWHIRSQFCGRCGAATLWNTREISKTCTQCNEVYYPKISPAIIVAITRPTDRGPAVLLAKHTNRPHGFYGLIAGFIEPGESAEEAVHREVLEETGIRIHRLRYWKSQPWPFPEGLMLGYTAEYHSGELEIQEDELTHAGFYTAGDLPLLPPALSLSRQLTDLVLGRGEEKK